jgi:hypothetical protein
MANRSAKTGAHSAGPQRGPAAAPPPGPAPKANQIVTWLPYLIVLAGAIAGLFIAWQGTRYAGRGAATVGAALLVAAVARLVLPPRYAGLLASRGKAMDVAAFAVFGAAVLAVAASLP